MKSLAVAGLMSLAFASFNAQATDIISVLNSGNPLDVPSINAYSASHTSSETGTQFWDDYTFTVGSSVANSATTTVSFASLFGISNLQARLYIGDTHQTGAIPSILQPWGTAVSADATSVSIDSATIVSTAAFGAKTLAAGTYTLQIRGLVTGAFGGGYTGTLQVAAVPETDTYAMLIAGLGVMGFVARRKTNKA